MSVAGQIATSCDVRITAALSPEADIRLRRNMPRGGPEPEVARGASTRWKSGGAKRRDISIKSRRIAE
jgi:hypothetical protein